MQNIGRLQRLNEGRHESFEGTDKEETKLQESARYCAEGGERERRSEEKFPHREIRGDGRTD